MKFSLRSRFLYTFVHSSPAPPPSTHTHPAMHRPLYCSIPVEKSATKTKKTKRPFCRVMERSTTSLASNGAPKGISYIEALRMAEEREKYVMSVFNRFDLDGSGTIDMDELLVLLDELGMVSKLKSDPEEFIRDMFVKYDTNFDGVLNWPEFVNLQNACLDDSLGRRKKDVNPKGSRKDGSTVDARKKLAADKAAKKTDPNSA